MVWYRTAAHSTQHKPKVCLTQLDNTGSSGDLLFVRKESDKYIPCVKRAVPQLWGTVNGTFQTKKVGEINISLVEYSASKPVHLSPNVVEFDAGAMTPMCVC